MVGQRDFKSVIASLNRGFNLLKSHFIIINFFFNFRFNRVLISPSGAMVRHSYFQSVIGPLKRGSTPLKAAFHFWCYGST